MEQYLRDLKFVVGSLLLIAAAFAALTGAGILVYSYPLIGGPILIAALPLLIRVI
jgi:hypothetical protein